MRCLIFLPVIGSLAGCASPADRMAADDRQCQSYGVAPGSPPYVDCRLRLDQQHANARVVNSLSPGSFILGTLQGN